MRPNSRATATHGHERAIDACVDGSGFMQRRNRSDLRRRVAGAKTCLMNVRMIADGAASLRAQPDALTFLDRHDAAAKRRRRRAA